MLRLGASPASSSLSVMRRAAVSRSWYRPEGPSGGPEPPVWWCSLVGVPRSPTHQRGCKHTSAALQNRAPAARQAQRGSSDEEMETSMFGGRTKGDMNRGAAVPGARTRRSWLAPCGSARKSSWWAVLRAWWYKKGAAGFPRLSQQEICGVSPHQSQLRLSTFLPSRLFWFAKI